MIIQKAFDSFSRGFEKRGCFVDGFFKSFFCVGDLVSEERVERKGISFSIKRWEARATYINQLNSAIRAMIFISKKSGINLKNGFYSICHKGGF